MSNIVLTVNGTATPRIDHKCYEGKELSLHGCTRVDGVRSRVNGVIYSYLDTMLPLAP
jgi:hypothetical protein